MSFGRNNSEDCHITSLAYFFDFSAVESVTGFDKREVMAFINGYETKMDNLGILGYVDITYILSEAVTNTVISGDVLAERIGVATDYYSLIYDILSNEEDIDNLDDLVSQASQFCYNIHNFFVIGFTAHLSYEEREYLSSVLYSTNIHDYIDVGDTFITLTDDVIIFIAAIPIELDEDEDYIQQIHSDIIARVNRNLSRSTQRSRRY